MNNILDVNSEEDYARVEPGVVLDDLNKTLTKFIKMFAPDPTSSAFCTIGGAVATNSAGCHAIKYGTTIDNILGLTVVLSNGEVVVFLKKDLNLVKDTVLKWT